MALAYVFTVFKHIIYGASVYFTSALSASTDVLDILALRFLMSFAVLYLLKVTGVLKIRVGLRDIFCPTERHRFTKALVLTAIFEPLLYMVLETWGITLTTGITAGVILSLRPVTGCIFEAVFLKERTTTLQKIFLAIGIVGVVHIAVHANSATGRDTPLGIFCLVLAVVCGSLYAVFSRKSSSHFSTFEITYFASMLAAAFFNLINVIRHLAVGDLRYYFTPYFNRENMIGFVFLAIISTVIATSMNNYAVSKLQVTTVSAFGGVSTLVTVAIGCLVADEKLYGFHLVGLTLILIRMVGVSWISVQKAKRKAAQTENAG